MSIKHSKSKPLQDDQIELFRQVPNSLATQQFQELFGADRGSGRDLDATPL